MNIFLAGASGLVGSAFARAAARRGHEVVGTVGTFTGPLEGLHSQHPVDLTNDMAITEAVLEVFPDAIVNCAAVSVPEQCDADPVRAQSLNVALPKQLARLAHHVSARMIHVSSEQVFDGTRSSPYAANLPPTPINLYGRQKVESEHAVHAAAGEFAVTIRAPLLMGNSVTGLRSNHERLFADWQSGRTANLFVDEFRQPCTADNLADVMVELCERNDVSGIFHWAGAELISRHALGLRIREHFKLSENEAPIAAVRRADVGDAARRRQPTLALDITPLASRLKTRPQSIAEQLEDLQVPAPARSWYFGRS